MDSYNIPVNFKELKVLIVDDIPENIKVLGNTLKEKGIQVLTALNGRQALAVASAKLPDLILLDIQMPEMDGYEVIKNLKSNPNVESIPVIFLTARTETDDIVKGFELGAVDYITKPFKTTELLARVLTHLKLKHAYDLILKQNIEISEEAQKIVKLNEKLISINNELEKSQSELKLANASKDKFFSIIAHDLRGPLGTLMGYVHILSENIKSFSDEELSEFINEMKKCADTTYNLLENLLEWATNQRGITKYSFELNNLYQISSDIIALLQPQAQDKFITLLNNLSKNTTAYIDKNTITTVIRNLISNAIKFTNSGTVAINAQIDDSELIISITDSGIGMSEENLDKIFRIDKSFSTQGTSGEKGTGLGLLLCKEFVEGNHGKIWVKSEMGKGTSFYFSLSLNPIV